MMALYAVGFALLGIPYWFLLAPVCGLLNLIPRFGALIAIALGLVLALVAGVGFERLLGLLAVFVVVLSLEGYWLTPRLIGRRLGLRPLYVFLAVLLGGALFGFFGLLLAIPVLAVALVVYRFYARRDA